MPQVTIITAHDGNLSFAELSARTYREYAKRWGYEFVEEKFRPLGPGVAHPSWQKLDLLCGYLEKLGTATWIVWVDTDTVVTNHTRPLPFPMDGTWMVVSKDWSDSESLWSAGVMMIAPCHASRWFFHLAAAKTKYRNSGCWDQSAMHEVCREHPNYSIGIRVLGRRILQSVPRECSQGVIDPWQPGDFIAHATGILQGDKAAILERCAAQAVR